MAGNIQRLSNGQVYIEGVTAFGTCESLELPEVEMGQTEYNALGTIGTLELPNNKIQAMEATIVWMHQPTEPSFVEAMYNFTRTTQFEIIANQAIFDGLGDIINAKYNCIVRGRPKQTGIGNFEGNEDTKPETVLAVDYVRVVANGQELCEYDARSTSGFRINGRLINTLLSGGLFA